MLKKLIDRIDGVLTQIDRDIMECKRVNPPEFVLYSEPWYYWPLEWVLIGLVCIQILIGGDNDD